MNAPIFATIEHIEMYRELLPEGFIEETIARQNEIRENHRNSMRALEQFKENCDRMAGQMEEIGSAFKLQASNFNSLHTSYKDFGRSMIQFQESSASLQKALSPIKPLAK